MKQTMFYKLNKAVHYLKMDSISIRKVKVVQKKKWLDMTSNDSTCN